MKELELELKRIEKKESILLKNKESIDEKLHEVNQEKIEILKVKKEIERAEEIRRKAYENYKRKKMPNEF